MPLMVNFIQKNSLKVTSKLNKLKQASVLPLKKCDENYVAVRQIQRASNNSLRLKENPLILKHILCLIY